MIAASITEKSTITYIEKMSENGVEVKENDVFTLHLTNFSRSYQNIFKMESLRRKSAFINAEYRRIIEKLDDLETRIQNISQVANEESLNENEMSSNERDRQ